jgi:hypothetical protein
LFGVFALMRRVDNNPNSNEKLQSRSLPAIDFSKSSPLFESVLAHNVVFSVSKDLTYGLYQISNVLFQRCSPRHCWFVFQNQRCETHAKRTTRRPSIPWPTGGPTLLHDSAPIVVARVTKHVKTSSKNYSTVFFGQPLDTVYLKPGRNLRNMGVKSSF